jgi:4'-phosphopantetheinyl transferase
MGVVAASLPTARVKFPRDEAHVWVVDLDASASVGADSQVLEDSERARAARYRFAVDRVRFVTRRSALRSILASYVDSYAGSIRFELGDKDRPSLAGTHRTAGLDFNVSHTGDLALVAVTATGRVGVDIERMSTRIDFAGIAEHWYSPQERTCIDAGCGASARHGFYRHWTAKEAYVKVLGCGLSKFREVELQCRPAPLVCCAGEPDESRRLTMLDVSRSHAAAIVTDDQVVRCHVWRWSA